MQARSPTSSSAARHNTSSSSSSFSTSSTPAADPLLAPAPPAEDSSEALMALLDYSLAHPHQQLGGPGGHPVLRLLQQRLADGSAPGARSDRFKLGLVVEGGGMRGIVTGAMLMGLQDTGMTQAFDAVYGASGGERTDEHATAAVCLPQGTACVDVCALCGWALSRVRPIKQ